MKRIFVAVIVLLSVQCKSKKNVPDISNIPVHLKVTRFEKDFFAMDTTHLSASLDTLNARHPLFFKDFVFNILGSLPQPDSALKYIAAYKKDYQNIYNAAEKKFPRFDSYQHQIEQSFRFIKYYFPDYKLPESIITYVGPIEGTANALTASGVAIGLQGYLGRDFPAYQTQYVSEIYPAYKSRKFEPEYIAVNCVKNILDDIFPPKISGRPLVEQMVEAGKRLYVLDALLPEMQDTIKTGYTLKQLEGCFKNEKNIWTFFIENNLLYETEPTLIAPYLNDGPNTPELGTDSPAFIGQFTGWQIVKKWMGKNEKISLNELMQKNARELFEEAKYKP